MMIPELLRILLVDDDAQQLEPCAQEMEMCGFSVVTADGPIKAISLLTEARTEAIDLAILDYNMPVMNGCLLAKQLKSLCPELKIILYSGAIDIPQTEMTSVDAFIAKCEGIGGLLDQIAQFVQDDISPAASDIEVCVRAHPQC